MLSLIVQKRKILGKKVKSLRKEGLLPMVLYGPKHKTTLALEVDYKLFEKVYKEAGESSLISLEIGKTKNLVLIQKVQKDPLTEAYLHVDFFQPLLEEEIETTVPLSFEGESLAIKEGGTLVKNIYEVGVRALPQNLPSEIKVNIEKLKTFEDSILIEDLIVSQEVKILKELDEVIALIALPEKTEEDLEKPIEEKVDEIERVEKKKGKSKEEVE